MDFHKEFKFTTEDFDYLRGIVTKTAGIVAESDKYTMYYSRLSRRLRALGLVDFRAYRQYLDAHRETESIELVNAVTTNLTSFYREKYHFEYLTETLIPDRINDNNKRLRIWSAGCSTGEEPYSIAMTLLHAIPDPDSWDIKILATDIDSNVLDTARKGVYDASRVAGLDHGLVSKFFTKSAIDNSEQVSVSPALRRCIDFKRLNLLDDWPLSETVDIIFCRNVVIYFDQPTKNKLIGRFAQRLAREGLLFMGHSETLLKGNNRFKLLGNTLYRLISD